MQVIEDKLNDLSAENLLKVSPEDIDSALFKKNDLDEQYRQSFLRSQKKP